MDFEEQLVRAIHAYVESSMNNPRETGKIYHQISDQVAGIIIEEALRICNDNQVMASDLLGISRSTLSKKLDDLQ